MQPINLDVSDLPAPEPFHQVMAAVSTLSETQYLLVHHRKQPMLLFQPLSEMGFDFHVRPGQTQAFEIIIWRKGQDCPVDKQGLEA